MRRFVSSAVFLLAGFGILAWSAVAALSPMLSRLLLDGASPGAIAFSWILSVVLLSLLFELPAGVLRAFLEGCHSFLPANLVDIAAQMLRAALTLVALTADQALLAVAAVFPATAFVRLLGMAAIARRAAIPFRPSLRDVSLSSLKPVRSFASFSLAEDTAMRWFLQLDSFLAARLLPLPELAILAVSRRFPSALSDLGVQPLAVTDPMVTEAAARDDRQHIRQFLIVSLRNVVAFSAPLIAALFVWAETILRLWIGPEVLSGVPVFRVFLLFAFFAVLQECPLTVFYATGRLRFCAAVSGARLALGLVLGAWAASLYGLVGLAGAYALIQAATAVVLSARAFRLAQLPLAYIYSKSLSPAVRALLPAVGWFWLSAQLLAHELSGLLISSALGLALFGAVFALQFRKLKGRPWAAHARSVLTEIG